MEPTSGTVDRQADGAVETSRATVIVTLIVLGITTIFAFAAWRREDAQMRQSLLVQINLIKSAVDLQHIQALRGSDTDLNTPQYRRLKEQMQGARAANAHCRFVYILRRLPDGSIIFLLDSEPPGSDDNSPPGQVYTESTPDVHAAFATGRNLTYGPARDRWGTWVSALAPITDPADGQVAAVVAMDIDARHWNQLVFAHVVGPVATTLLVGVLLAVLIITRRRIALENQRLETYSEALKTSEDRYRRIIETAVEGVWAMDAGMVTTYVNRQMADALGYVPEEMVGRNVREFMFPEDTGTHDNRMERRKRGESEQYEWRFRHRDGTAIWMVVSATALKDETGAFAGSFAMFTDITERKRMEDALRESEERHRRFINSTDDLVFLKDGQLRYVLTNRANEEFFGLSGDQIAGHTDEELMPPEQAEGCRASDMAALESGEVVITTETAGDQVFEIRKFPVPLADGQVGVGGVIRDITQQRQAQEQLLLQALVLDQISDRVTVTDLEGFISYVNQAEIDELGYTREELIGRSVRAYGDDPEIGATQDEIIRCTLRDGQWRGEVANQTADGRTIVLDCRTQVVHDLTGAPIALCGIATDITERKQAERALRLSEERLSSIFRAAPVGIGVVCDRVLLEINQRVCDMTGYSREELVGQSSRVLYQSQEEFERVGREKYGQIDRNSGNGVGTVETRWLTKGGQAIDVLLSSTAMDPDNPDLGFTFTALDITDRKKTTDALRKSENLLRRIVDVLPVGLWISDSEGRLISSNATGRRIWGAEALVGQEEYGKFKARRLPSGQEIAPDDWALARTVNEGVTILDELLEIEAFDGVKRIILNHTAPVLDDDGNVEAAIVVNQDVTDRVRSEELLRDSEERLRLTFDQGPIGASIVDLNLRFIRANTTLCSFLGYTEEELLTMTSPEVTHPDDVANDRRHFTLLVEGQIDQYITDKRYIRKNGEVVWGHMSMGLVRDERGQPLHLLPMVEDITHRVRAEEALQASEDRYRTITDNSPIAIVLIRDRQVIFANPVAVRMLGREGESDVIGLGPDDLVGPDHSDAVRARLEAIIAGGPSIPMEFPLRRPDGLKVVIEAVAGMIQLDDGPAVLVMGVDTTERRQAETQAQQLKRVFEQALFGAAMVDLAGTLTYVNPAMARDHGYEPWELLGESMEIMHTPEQMPAVEAITRQMLDTGMFPPTEVWHVHRDGHAFPMLMTGVTLFDADGQPTAMAATALDITDRKRAEDSARLATVGQLAAGVAHEFNNLLASLLLTSERALDTRALADYERLAEVTRRQAMRGADICRGLAAFSRPPTPRREPIHMETPIDCALSLAAHQIEISGISVVRKTRPSGTRFLGDPGQLEQVFLNLFINAIHAMPGGGTLTVSTEHIPHPSGPGVVVARVSDTGIGMSPEQLRRVFEPFFTTKGRLGESDVPGTGLGLTVSHGIVTAHGGTITARSEPGKGTTFELSFPANAPGSDGEPESHGGVDRTRDIRITATILLAEDEADLRETMAAVLRCRGLDVRTAGSATEAIREIQTSRLDLVITDLLMPGGGGKAVLEYVAALGEALPVVVLTGQDGERAAEQVGQLGASGCLRKPLSADEVFKEIRRVLREAREEPGNTP